MVKFVFCTNIILGSIAPISGNVGLLHVTLSLKKSMLEDVLGTPPPRASDTISLCLLMLRAIAQLVQMPGWGTAYCGVCYALK